VATVVYALCAATALLCAIALLRAYSRSRVRLLFWSGLAFVGLSVSNALLFADFVIVTERDLSPLRATSTFLSIAVLLFGLLWEDQ
jgi:hypothetical protein